MFKNGSVKIAGLAIICFLGFVWPLFQVIHYLDKQIFFIANSVLQIEFFQYFFGYLNHSYERKLNLIFLIAVSVFAYLDNNKGKKRKHAIDIIAIFVGLQLWLLVINLIFTDILEISRESPSLALPMKYNLAEIIGDTNIKISSRYSFPGGHAFVAFYWFLSLSRYSSRRVQIYAFVVSMLMALPRLFVGAHWFSDILFSLWFAVLVIQIDLHFKLWYFYILIIKSFQKVIKWLRSTFYIG